MPDLPQNLNPSVEVSHSVHSELSDELTPRDKGEYEIVGPADPDTFRGLGLGDKIPDQPGIVGSEAAFLYGRGDGIVSVFTLRIMKRTHMSGRCLLCARDGHATKVTETGK